jgi:hypothetical protein
VRHRIVSSAVVVLGSGLLLIAGASLAAEPGAAAQKEVGTAITHAGFAASANEAKTTHLHLHHVINCLVGPGGHHFDAKAGDPCQNLGRGALQDAKAAKLGEAVRGRLGQALQLALVGVGIEDAGPAADVAKAVEGLLKEAQQQMQPPGGKS